jgi:HAD superfamily hydrolase (TIGR01549 family)
VIKAVFFDWFNTLTHFEPPRAELYSRAFQQFGIELAPKAIMRGILAADLYFFEENVKSPVEKRSAEEQAEVYGYYPKAILAEAGVKVAEELPLKILKIVQQQFKGDALVLFDDVLSTLKMLKERRLILGLLTNATKDKLSLHRKLGLERYLDFVVTSQEAGADKPKPPIFLAALDRAKVKAFEALHVGDQYQLDVVGARGAGINPILIDRYDLYPDVSNCPRIRSFTELAQYLG